jgi:hypothetical protein
VNVFFGKARTRAIELGRPVGVLFTRDSSQGNPCLTLQQVEIPPTYAGDVSTTVSYGSGMPFSPFYSGAAYVCGCPNVTSSGSTTYFTTNVDGSIPYTVEMFLSPTINTGSSTSPSPVLQPGNNVQLGYQGSLYTIPPNSNTPPSTLPPPQSVTSKNGQTYTLMFATLNLPSSFPPNTQIPWAPPPTPQPALMPPWPPPQNLGSPPSWPPTSASFSFTDPPSNAPVAFQITCQPSFNLKTSITAATQSAVAPLQLPPGTVIDLQSSGTNNASFGVNPQPTKANPAPPPNVGMIVFSPTGSVYEVFANYTLSQVVDPIYFLIGRRDRMFTLNMSNSTTVTYNSTTGQWTPQVPAVATEIPPNDGLANWQDLSNLWVSVTPQTGRITTVEIASVTASATSGITNANGIVLSRAFALQGQSKGGR